MCSKITFRELRLVAAHFISQWGVHYHVNTVPHIGFENFSPSAKKAIAWLESAAPSPQLEGEARGKDRRSAVNMVLNCNSGLQNGR